MVSILELAIGAAVGTVVTVLIEEVISSVIRRTAKVAGTSPTVIRDIVAAMRVIAILIILAAILSLTGLASEFTTLTISGIGALAVSLALQNTLSNIISGIFLLSDGVIHLNDIVEYGGVKGKVVRLALRNTWIKMDSGKIAVISNSLLSGGPLINHSATAHLSKKYAIEQTRHYGQDPLCPVFTPSRLNRPSKLGSDLVVIFFSTSRSARSHKLRNR
jgi:small conductance mechanosensitive channel